MQATFLNHPLPQAHIENLGWPVSLQRHDVFQPVISTPQHRGLEEPVTFSISLRAEPPSKRSERSERSSLWPPARPQELKARLQGARCGCHQRRAGGLSGELFVFWRVNSGVNSLWLGGEMSSREQGKGFLAPCWSSLHIVNYIWEDPARSPGRWASRVWTARQPGRPSVTAVHFCRCPTSPMSVSV